MFVLIWQFRNQMNPDDSPNHDDSLNLSYRKL